MEKSAELGIDEQAWAVRASACELLALSLRYPDEELVGAVASGEWAQAAREIWGALGIELPENWAAGLDEPNACDIHDMRVEATRLFVGVPTPECSPHEGFWRAQDEGVQPLMFVNPHTMAVERFCRACGLGQPEGTNEPLDHIATELELLQYLAAVEAGLIEPLAEGPSLDALPGGGAAAAYDEFMCDHLLTFAPRFAERLARDARTGFYRAVGQLLGAYVMAETPETAEVAKV